MPTTSTHDSETTEWIARDSHDDRVCRAMAQAADLVRSIDYHDTSRKHFVGRLNEHLQATGITLPARLGAWDVSDDGDGGVIIRLAGIGGGR